MGKNMFLAPERIDQLVKDYDVSKNSIYFLYVALINCIDDGQTFDKVFFF